MIAQLVSDQLAKARQADGLLLLSESVIRRLLILYESGNASLEGFEAVGGKELATIVRAAWEAIQEERQSDANDE